MCKCVIISFVQMWQRPLPMKLVTVGKDRGVSLQSVSVEYIKKFNGTALSRRFNCVLIPKSRGAQQQALFPALLFPHSNLFSNLFRRSLLSLLFPPQAMLEDTLLQMCSSPWTSKFMFLSVNRICHM